MNLLKILDSTPEPPIIELDFDECDNSRIYNLPCPMYEYQKELTDQIISLHYPEILKFCELNDKKEIIIDSLSKCIKNLMLITTHPYLMIDHYMPKNLSYKEMPNKLAETSGKFNVLRDLLNVLIEIDSPKNIGLVISDNGRLFDLIESLLLGCHSCKTVKRYFGNNIQRESKKNSKNGNGYHSDNNGTSKKLDPNNSVIHLIPDTGALNKDQEIFKRIKFDVLIIIDQNVDQESDFFRRIKYQNNRQGAIIINLIPLNTIEHIKLFTIDLYKIISSVVCLRDNIGNLPPDFHPIYQQKLAYFNKFFESVLKLNQNPNWPLPSLPKISTFSPSDVERSLLTETQYNYINYTEEDKKIPSYYESKRLKSHYITNPLINSYDKLSGIESLTQNDTHHLTHKLMLNLNTKSLKLKDLRNELASYIEDRENLIGRREKDLKLTVSNLVDDINHNEQRINCANKLIIKKNTQIEEIKERIIKLENELKEKYSEENEAYSIQYKIWKLQNEIKNYITKIKLKNDEKNFTNQELKNCQESIKDSEIEIKEYEEKIESEKRKFNELETQKHTEIDNEYKIKKQKLVEDIEKEQLINKQLKLKYNQTFRFLKDTSHLKKRKGRGITPK
ncbi:unnamed protein product [Candida verbasci]|uniref:HDA1 complex subunit 3 n=1 Tax=Candida verbasci TaxID=1227364 RepID=A0A9W4XBM0_9ASCO|nr:unnamed protein product [Candida verbasci]